MLFQGKRVKRMKREELKIIIADDSALTRKQLYDMLTEIGCKNIRQASNGNEAFEAYKEEKADLVILDIIMPECDGISAIKAIKEYDNDATIVMCSTIGTQLKLKEAINAGAKDFIQKPARMDQLQYVISKIAED